MCTISFVEAIKSEGLSSAVLLSILLVADGVLVATRAQLLVAHSQQSQHSADDVDDEC